jgi:hypothetical protein
MREWGVSEEGKQRERERESGRGMDGWMEGDR